MCASQKEAAELPALTLLLLPPRTARRQRANECTNRLPYDSERAPADARSDRRGWIWRSTDEHTLGTQVSLLLLPALYLFGLSLRALQLAGVSEPALSILPFGRPFAEVVCVVGLAIQTHGTAENNLYKNVGPCRWWASAATHFLIVFVYMGVEITRAAVAVALAVFVVALAAYSCGVPWPYDLSPAVCVVLVSLLLFVRLL